MLMYEHTAMLLMDVDASANRFERDVKTELVSKDPENVKAESDDRKFQSTAEDM